MKFVRFESKPQLVNAIQWDGIDPDVFPELERISLIRIGLCSLLIPRDHRGESKEAFPGDWIVVTPDGSLRVLNPAEMHQNFSRFSPHFPLDQTHQSVQRTT